MSDRLDAISRNFTRVDILRALEEAKIQESGKKILRALRPLPKDEQRIVLRAACILFCIDPDTILDGQACRVCGCTQNNACEGGCYWVEPDLCSECVGKKAARKVKQSIKG